MVASLDGYIARRDGSTEWLETSDHFEHGATLAHLDEVEVQHLADWRVGNLPVDKGLQEVQPAIGQQNIRRDDAVLLLAHLIPRKNGGQSSPAD